MKLSKEHRNTIISGLIGAGLLALSLWIKSLFKKEDPPKTETKVSVNQESPKIIANDSATQIAPQIKQDLEKGATSNIEISGTKTVNNYSAKPSSIPKKSDTPIVNSGIMNIGGTGNTYNQNLYQGATQRTLNDAKKAALVAFLPNKHDINFVIGAYNYDPESTALGQEIQEFLIEKNYTKDRHSINQAVGFTPPKEKLGMIDVELSPDSSMIKVTIYPLPKQENNR